VCVDSKRVKDAENINRLEVRILKELEGMRGRVEFGGGGIRSTAWPRRIMAGMEGPCPPNQAIVAYGLYKSSKILSGLSRMFSWSKDVANLAGQILPPERLLK
jgi:hypothetical protein